MGDNLSMSKEDTPQKGERNMDEQVSTSFRLLRRDVELLRVLAKQSDRSSSSLIRKLIREEAERKDVRLEEQ